MSKNTNRDYLIIVDVKSSTIKEFNKLEFYINDKESHNIFVQLVVKESHDIINKYTPIDDPNLYELAMNIVKPTNEHKRIMGELISLEDGLYEFKLPQDCCDKVGTYMCELETLYNSRITNSNSIKYRIKKSVLNDLDDVVDAPGYPIVIQLLEKLSDIDQYEEDRRANELARQLAEEQRQTRFDALDADMTDSIQAMDNKVVEVENRITAKEQAVDTLMADTKADIDEYKVAKDQEIDDYKTAKDAEINNAITDQDNKIDEAISNQNDRITAVENNVVAQNNRLDVLETKATTHEARITATEAKNTEQDNRLDIAENRLNNIGNDITNTMQPIIDEHTSRLEAIEAIDVAQNTRLDAIEAKNQQQDDRLLGIEKVNKRQDMNLKCLFAESKNNMIDITEEGNSIYLQNSTIGYTLIDEIQGNTLVNCNKEPDKELILNGNINTSGDNNITITEGVDGGLVDVALEGNTLVNVSKTKDITPITEAYTVENSGNHVALQGDVDGSCRPVVTGKTLVNLVNHNSNKWSVNTNSNGYKVNAYKRYSLNIGIQPNKTYTVVLSEMASSCNGYALFQYSNNEGTVIRINAQLINNKYFTINLTDITEPLTNDIVIYQKYNAVDGNIDPSQESNFYILEGDYTNKPIPDYFEGLQSTFEDNLVTQEKVDSGKEVADNLGKYRVDYKTVGKNKYNQIKTPFKPGSIALERATITNNGDNIVLNGTLTKVFDYRPTWLDELYNYVNSCQEGTVLTLSNNLNGVNYWMYTENGSVHFDQNSVTIRSSMSNISCFVRFNEGTTFNESILNVQIEEGDTATEYEPYKEHIKTLYLNSPLLEGDTIEEKDGGIYHVHRSEKVVLDGSEDEKWNATGGGSDTRNTFEYTVANAKYFDGVTPTPAISNIFKYEYTRQIPNKDNCFRLSVNSSYYGYLLFTPSVDMIPHRNLVSWRAYLSNSPVVIIYPSQTPAYELIEQSNLVIPSYANGHLGFNTAIPVEKAEFKPFTEELTYLYANTQYTLQFISDKATTVDIALGGTQLLAKSIVTGLNRIAITTPATLVDNKLIIDGVGANISEVVVTDTNREFRYFEGMKSVGECEDNVEILFQNKNLIDPSRVVKDKDIDQQTGEVIDKSNYYALVDYVPIQPNKPLIYNATKVGAENNPINGTMFHFYDINKKHIYSCWILATGKLPDSVINEKTPSNAYYLRISYAINNNWGTSYESLLTGQLEYGTTKTDYIPHQSNTQQLTHEPLRAVGDVKDRYVLIDGKWYIERNCGKLVLNGIENWSDNGYGALTGGDVKMFQLNRKLGEINNDEINVVSNVIKGVNANTTWNKDKEGISLNKYGYIQLRISTSKLTEADVNSLKTWLNSNNIKCIYKLASPTYEPIDYNPLEVYSDITHITTNSTIPTNVVVKNHGFNCLLKPSTTYTISSNLGLNTVTTGADIGDSCLRFYDTDTSDVTTMKDVLVLEGDWTSKANLIPANFSGIESAFEQELVTDEADEHYGKYRVNAKVANEDKSKENNITFYINEPLRGVGDVKDRIYVKDDKVIVQRNCGIRAYEGGDFGTYPTDKVNTVYPLAEPTYEEVEYNDTKLFIESFKNSTLFYNSNVPVTSKLYYSYSVPIVDTVAQTANISDEQDLLLVNMATEIAIMQLTL